MPYCQNKNCKNKGKEIKKTYKVIFAKKLFRPNRINRKEALQVINEYIQYCKDCAELDA